MLGGGAHSEPKREPVVESKRKPVVVSEHFAINVPNGQPIDQPIVVAVVVAFGVTYVVAVDESVGLAERYILRRPEHGWQRDGPGLRRAGMPAVPHEPAVLQRW